MKKIRVKENALLGVEQMQQILGGDGSLMLWDWNNSCWSYVDVSTTNASSSIGVSGAEDYSSWAALSEIASDICEMIGNAVGSYYGGLSGGEAGSIGTGEFCGKIGRWIWQGLSTDAEAVASGKARPVFIGYSPSTGTPIYGAQYY